MNGMQTIQTTFLHETIDQDLTADLSISYFKTSFVVEFIIEVRADILPKREHPSIPLCLHFKFKPSLGLAYEQNHFEILPIVMASHSLAIAKASLAAGMIRPDPTSISKGEIAHFHTLLEAVLKQCSSANIQV